MFVIFICVILITSVFAEAGNANTYGDIMLLQPTGKRGRDGEGVAYSWSQINYSLHIGHLRPSKQCYMEAGSENGLHPALIAAVASRESNFGDSLRSDGWGDCHGSTCYGYGIMQCDKRYDPVSHYSKEALNCKSHPWDSCDHVKMMTKYVIVPMVTSIKNKFPSWKPEQQIQGGIAAYNTGPGRVNSWTDVDRYTTGYDYSNDVIARAKYLVLKKGWVSG